MPTFKQNDRHRATGRVTLSDVALAAGVSPITVSRALRGTRAVDPDLVQRVRVAVHKLGYVPDPAARALASQRSNHVAVLIPMLSNELFVTVLESLQSCMRGAGYQTLIGVTHYDPHEEETLLREHLLHRPAGLLVTGFDHTPATRQLMARSGVPCVHLMESSGDGGYCVGFSQSAAAADLTRHLIERDKKRIAFAAAQLDPRTLQRLEGWRQVMRAQGLWDATLEWMNPAPSSMGLGGRMFEQIMGQSPAIDAIFFCNDDLAQGAALAANRMKVAVPQRVALVGFNDLTGSEFMIPPLTTVHTSLARIGEEAARMLVQLMRDEPVPVRSVDVGYTVIVRQST